MQSISGRTVAFGITLTSLLILVAASMLDTADPNIAGDASVFDSAVQGYSFDSPQASAPAPPARIFRSGRIDAPYVFDQSPDVTVNAATAMASQAGSNQESSVSLTDEEIFALVENLPPENHLPAVPPQLDNTSDFNNSPTPFRLASVGTSKRFVRTPKEPAFAEDPVRVEDVTPAEKRVLVKETAPEETADDPAPIPLLSPINDIDLATLSDQDADEQAIFTTELESKPTAAPQPIAKNPISETPIAAANIDQPTTQSPTDENQPSLHSVEIRATEEPAPPQPDVLKNPAPKKAASKTTASPQMDAKKTIRRQKKRKPPKREPSRGWVQPKAIVTELQSLTEVPVTQQWANSALQLVEDLLAQKDVSSDGSQQVLNEFVVKIQELAQIIAIVEQRFPDSPHTGPLVSNLRRLEYNFSKRLAIWQSISKLPKPQTASNSANPSSPFRLASFPNFSLGEFDASWRAYLRLDEIDRSFAAGVANAKKRKQTARATLARLYSPTLSDAQRGYLASSVSPEALATLKAHATGAIDQSKLLRAMEFHERTPSGVAAHYINDQYQNLLWSTDPAHQQAAAHLHAHYRNANVRFAISQRFINRLIPPSPAQSQPIKERILGADVEGTSIAHNRLRISTIPDASQIHLRLNVDGHVDSDTVAVKSGFHVRNSGLAHFQAYKEFTLDQQGTFRSLPAAAYVQADQHLVGLNSKLDNVPVVNKIANRIARKKVAEEKPESLALFESKVKRSAIRQLETDLESKIAQAQTSLKTSLLQPLISMDLEPEAIQTTTTANRVLLRFRLAGTDQLAAYSARLRDSDDDYLNLQLHQSLINNFAQRVDIASGSFTPHSLMKHLENVIGYDADNINGTRDHDAKFTFANFDPIRVDFKEDKVRIELNLKSLQVGKGKVWRNITIAATYIPLTSGSKIIMKQDGIIEVKGRRFRLGDQFAVRAIFKVVLPKKHEFDAIPTKFRQQMKGFDLAISKLDIMDGWFGLSFEEVNLK